MIVLLILMIFEGILYLKDYNNLLMWNCYIKYDIINDRTKSFYGNDLKFEMEGDGKYNIVLKRKSLFNIERYKKIKYNGIVE